MKALKAIVREWGGNIAVMFLVMGATMVALMFGTRYGWIPAAAHDMPGPVLQAGMVAPVAVSSTQAGEKSYGLSEYEFSLLLSCVREYGGELEVPKSKGDKRHLRFVVPFLYNFELRLEDGERVIGAFIYSRQGVKKGWVQRSHPEAGRLTEKDFVDSAQRLLDGPCSSSSLSALWRKERD